MIETEFDGATGLLKVTMQGEITAEEYRETLIPAIDAATEGGTRVKLLASLPDGIKGFTAGAAWEDTQLGLKHWSGFDRVAVVVDPGATAGAIRVFSALMPCPVMTFPIGNEAEALEWLEKTLGEIRQNDLGDGIMHIQFIGQVDKAAYDGVPEKIDAFIRSNDRFRLLIDLSEFDGWQGISGVFEHLSMAWGRSALVEKVAVVVDARWQRAMVEIGRHTIRAEVEVFEELDAAKDWIEA